MLEKQHKSGGGVSWTVDPILDLRIGKENKPS